MKLFDKKKETTSTCCSCNHKALVPLVPLALSKPEGVSIKILGSGCVKCNQLEAATKEALAELSIDTMIDHVTDFAQIAAYGVMTTPALVVDGKVVSYGKALKKNEVLSLLQKVWIQ